MTPKDIGNNIAYFRKKVNLSQKDLAKKLNVSNKLVSKWETGLSYPSIEYLNEISSILDVDIKYLISSNEYDEAAITNPPAQKKKGISKTTSYIIAGILSIFVLLGVTALNIFLIAPAIFKPIYAKELDKTVANSFNSQNMTIEQTIAVDGIETKIKEEMSLDKTTKELRYLNYEDDELTLAIYHDVKYDIEQDKRTNYTNTYNNLIDFYDEINGTNDVDFDIFNKDTIKYVRNEFSNYILTLDYKDFNNAFSDLAILKNARIKSDIKVKIKTKNKKLSYMQMNFKMSVNNEVLDVVSKTKFSYPKNPVEINLTNEQFYMPWLSSLFDYKTCTDFNLINEHPFSAQNSIGYKDKLIYFDANTKNIMQYDVNTETSSVLCKFETENRYDEAFTSASIVNDILYFEDYEYDGDYDRLVYKINLTEQSPTPELLLKSNRTTYADDATYFVDANNNCYYYDSNSKIKLLNSDAEFKGYRIIGAIDNNFYTIEEGRYDRHIYQYTDNQLVKTIEFPYYSNTTITKIIIDQYILICCYSSLYGYDKDLNLIYEKAYIYSNYAENVSYDENVLFMPDFNRIFLKDYEIPPININNLNCAYLCDNYYVLQIGSNWYKIEKQSLISLIKSQVHQY